MQRMVAPLTALPRGVKRLLAMTLDACLAILAVWLAFYLRLGDWIALSDRGWEAALLSLLVIPIFHAFGIYHAAFRHSGSSVNSAIWPAALLYVFIYSSALTAIGIKDVPRTIGFIQPCVFILLVIVSRIVTGLFLSGRVQYLAASRRQGTRVLIYGAGSAGRQLAAALAESASFRAVGFVDDDQNLHGSVIGGLKVWRRADIDALAAELDIKEVFLAIPSADRRRRNEILDTLRRAGLGTRTLPGILDIAHGKVTVTDLKPLEIDDLLGREPMIPKRELLERNIRNKCVLVTGAGGSIGSELCRQIAQCHPATLILLDINEYGLYAIHHELSGLDVGPDRELVLIPLLGSVTDPARLEEIFATWRPQTVYHAAAYKHVPLVEQNAIEGVHNNVIGTWRTASAALRHDTDNFVLVSTDKAVRPTNIMGASKRMAEMLLQALAADSDRVRFTMVRFGNVLGSSGSVVPLFRNQIALGGPLTVTHPEIIRYFMTIPEAAQLVLQAGAMGKGGEVFVLDMGEPVKIYDLAVRMIELAGLKPKLADDDIGDVEIAFTGLRPGEKLYEELLIGDNPSPTSHPRVMMANERFLPRKDIETILATVEQALDARDVGLLRASLKHAVEEFAPAAEVVDWVAVKRSQAAQPVGNDERKAALVDAKQI